MSNTLMWQYKVACYAFSHGSGKLAVEVSAQKPARPAPGNILGVRRRSRRSGAGVAEGVIALIFSW